LNADSVDIDSLKLVLQKECNGSAVLRPKKV
jgi:hypothetical protein